MLGGGWLTMRRITAHQSGIVFLKSRTRRQLCVLSNFEHGGFSQTRQYASIKKTVFS